MMHELIIELLPLLKQEIPYCTSEVKMLESLQERKVTMQKPGTGFLFIGGIIIFFIGFGLQGVWMVLGSIIGGILCIIWLLTLFGIVPFH